MLKQFTITTSSVVVPASVVPSEYRIDFTGPAAVPAVHIPYATLAPVTADFAVDGDYTAVAGLYDASAALLGTVTTAVFNVTNAAQTKPVNAVGGLTITDA